MKKWAGLVGVVLIMVVIVRFFIGGVTSIDEPPTPEVSVNERDIPVTEGSYCWDSGTSAECVDKIYKNPVEMAEQHDPTSVLKGATIQLDFSPYPEQLKLTLWREDGTREKVETRDHTITVPNQEGLYIYEMEAAFDQGDVPYAFSVRVGR